MIQDVDIEPIIAYRSWNAMWPYFLSNLNSHDIWMPGERVEARCAGGSIKTEHESPHRECTCGIYALKTPTHETLHGSIFGEVYLWGRVLEGSQGYRAQYAYPKRLYWNPERKVVTEDQAALISGVYGVSIEPNTEWHAAAKGTEFHVTSYSNYVAPVRMTLEGLVAVALSDKVDVESRKYARQAALQKIYMGSKSRVGTIKRLEETLVLKKKELARFEGFRVMLKPR